LLDLVDDAGLRRAIRCDCAGWQRRVTEAGCVKVRIGEFDIDEVPPPRLLVMLAVAVSVGIPISVGSGRGAVGGQIVGVGRA